MEFSVKRILILLTLFSTLVCRSQMNSPPIKRDFNCNHDGAIFLDITQGSQVDWYFDDDSLGLVMVVAMQDIIFFNNFDTLITQNCGNYKIVISGDTTNIFVGCPLGSMGQHVNVQCFGDSTGQLFRVAHSGAPFANSTYIYRWVKDGIIILAGPNSTVLDSIPIGDYHVIISDSLLCSDTIFSTITSPLSLIIDSITTVNINCRGLNSGILTVSAYGGRPYTFNESYNYYIIQYNTGDTVSFNTRTSTSSNFSTASTNNIITFDSLFSGIYMLSVVDSFGCTTDTIFEIIEPIEYNAYGSSTDKLICESDSGFLKIDSVTGDSSLGSDNLAFGFAYNNVNYIHIDSIFSSSGWHQIYVYDSTYFCLDTVSIKFNALYEIKVFESLTNVTCYGNQSGSIVIDSITGGNAPYDVQWGSVDNLYLASGSYQVNFVDSIGCFHTEVYAINEPSQINSNANVSHPLCYGDSNGSIYIYPSGGTGLLSYYWQNSSFFSDSINDLDHGTYTLIVIDSVACIDTFTFELQNPAKLEVNISATNPSLSFFGEITSVFADISGGNPSYLVTWNDLDTNQQRLVGAGYYEVFITDANACVASDSILIIEPDELSLEIEIVTQMSCNEGATITATTNGGIPPFTYMWGGPNNFSASVATIDSLFDIGMYTLIISDSLGVLAVDTISIQSYELSTEIYYDTLNHIAEIQIVNSTSSGPFLYEWLDTLYNHSNLRFPSYNSSSPFLCSNFTYFVITTDSSNNCSVSNMFTVPKDLIFLDIVDLQSSTTEVNISSLTNSWGTPPYIFFWNDSLGSNTSFGYPCPMIDSSLVEITDYNDCILLYKFIIEDIIISLDPASAILECDLENLDIALKASATGGTGDYTYTWWNGTNVNPINLGMNPGNFNLSVTDDNGCKADTSFKIATFTSECVPNVFTPNGDGINDYWSLEDTFLYEDSEILIYGRFGKLIFQSFGYHNKWEGKNEKGESVPDGIYFYTIKIGSGFKPINGSVTILR